MFLLRQRLLPDNGEALPIEQGFCCNNAVHPGEYALIGQCGGRKRRRERRKKNRFKKVGDEEYTGTTIREQAAVLEKLIALDEPESTLDLCWVYRSASDSIDLQLFLKSAKMIFERANI